MGSTDEGFSRDAPGDHIADLADDRPVRTDLDGQAGNVRRTRRPSPFDVRRVDHPLGVVLTLGGELDLATVPMLQEHLDRATCSGAVGGHRPGSAGVHRLQRSRCAGASGPAARGPPAGNSCSWADRGRCTASLSSRAWIRYFDGSTPQTRPYEPRSCDVLGAPDPPPARTDRPRPSSTANSEEGDGS